MSEGRDKTERMRNREFVRTFESDIGLMSEVFEFI